MANLFKNKVIKQKIESYQIPNLKDKLSIIMKWHEAYKDGSLSKKTESQCEQAFNQDIFVDVLDYSTFPNKPYSIDPKATVETSSQKADAILGYFTDDKKVTTAVVEIKDVRTLLDKSQSREGSMSPIQQAFKYKPQYKECRFVIATNFYEIRLFQDNQLDYEVFTLDSLVDPKDDFFEFRKFYYLLCVKNFTALQGKTNTENLLSEIRIDQEKITSDFYEKYKTLRLELMRNIWKKNKDKHDIVFVTNKAQKIIDRIVFVCFCEDADLLPEDTLFKVIKHAENSFSSVWDTLKGFFNAIDKGSSKLEIPRGYNGGLFKDDHELNKLVIEDNVCKDLLALSKFDFKDDLTVNILGHIFEQSITDLEAIRSKVNPDEVDTKSRRKKEGIYYTPDYIVSYIVENSLGKYLEDKLNEVLVKYKVSESKSEDIFDRREKEAYKEYQDFLNNIKVLDPACGSGAFLVKVFDYLLEEHRKIGKVLGGLFETDEIYKDILKNNIFGVDLSEESVEIAKLSLWLKTAQKGKKLTFLDENIKCGNSLIDDPNIAGNKAFNWNTKFHEIMDKGGFHVIVGNPPYVNVRNLSNIDKNYFSSIYQTARNQYDLYVLFIEKSLNILKDNGFLSFIVPNKFLITQYGLALRKFICHHSVMIAFKDYSRNNVFPDASVYPVIIILNKKNNLLQKIEDDKKYNILKIFGFEKKNSILEKLDLIKDKLGSILLIKEAIHTGNIRNKLIVKERKNNNTYKLLRGQDTQRYFINWANLWIDYSVKPDKINNEYASLPEREYFTGKKILLREIALRPTAVYDKEGYFTLNKSYVLKQRNDANINLLYILALINSRLMAYYFENKFGDIRVAGGYLQFKKQFTSELPIIFMKNQNVLSEKAKEMSNLSKNFTEQLDNSLGLIKSRYSLKSLSNTIKQYYKFGWSEFITELEKLNIKLNLIEQENLQQWFEKKRQELQKIKNAIMILDKDIDNEVYKIYQLTKEEIQIVENY